MGIGCGLLCLCPLYSIGGMAGDVKLMAGIGAWLGAAITWNSFLVTIVVGAVMAVVMVLWSGKIQHHVTQFFHIAWEIVTIRDPNKLFAIAKERNRRCTCCPTAFPSASDRSCTLPMRSGFGLI